MTPEGKIKAAVDKLLKRYGVWYFKPVSNGMGTHGIPDYIVCVASKFLAIECKGADNLQPTALQRNQLDRIGASGGVAFVATPGTLVKLEHLLMELTA